MIDSKLLTLVDVVETKNYSMTAKRLSLTQSAVSQQIKQLEKELEIKVFFRNGSEIKLTKDGEILYKYARRIISLYNDLESRILDQKNQTKSLVIGITHTSESNIIAQVLAYYCSKYKGVKIKIITDSISNLYDKLSTYEIDLAIVEGKVFGKKFSSILLDTDSLVVVMGKNNPLVDKKVININDLKKEKMILRSTGSGTRSLFTQALQNQNMSIDQFNVMMEVDNIATIKELVCKNFGISILPRSVIYDEVKNKTLVALPIENFNMIREINMVFLKDFSDMNALDNIMEIYKEMTNGNIN